MIDDLDRPVWATPDFTGFDTPMEVTRYVARMD
jgi:coenzyme PQQ precursor peptide PqqA